MAVIRAFIAIDLSAEIIQRLEEVAGQLKQRLAGMQIRWVPVENIHLTLKFLGDVSMTNLEVLKKILLSESSNHPTFEMSVGELGAFPSLRRPRVIWVGITAPSELNALQHGIETETARLGYQHENRDFSPHLTLGRVSRNASSQEAHQIGQVLDSFKVGFLGATRVREVYLYRSDLRPGGAVYTRLMTALLQS